MPLHSHQTPAAAAPISFHHVHEYVPAAYISSYHKAITSQPAPIPPFTPSFHRSTQLLPNVHAFYLNVFFLCPQELPLSVPPSSSSTACRGREEKGGEGGAPARRPSIQAHAHTHIARAPSIQ
uniref:Uncharacterized protein n=1 Tax=Aegilops tauschii subsp. strangulata TaxID=200361 RepID=A0A453P2N7_AEGTS